MNSGKAAAVSGTLDDDDVRSLLRTRDADQAAEGARDLARVIGGFRKQCLIEGFQPDETFELTREFFAVMLDNGDVITPGADDDEDD